MDVSVKKGTGKYNSIDLFKLIMSVCVIAIHTQPLINCQNELVVQIYEAIVGMAVPFFFLSTGFLIYEKTRSGGVFYLLILKIGRVKSLGCT